MAKKSKPNDSAATGLKVITVNRRASFLFTLFEKFEAGLMLTGSEVKSLRDGHANLSDGYVDQRHDELYLLNAHISPYPAANRFNHEPLRPRKLLLHQQEIGKILGKMKERGFTVVPTRMYFKKGRAKCEIALAKGKKLHDKRESIKRKEQDRIVSRSLRNLKS